MTEQERAHLLDLHDRLWRLEPVPYTLDLRDALRRRYFANYRVFTAERAT